MSSDSVHWRQRICDRADAATVERALWAVVALSLVGDVATTFLGLHLGMVEANPVARGAIEGHGLLGMLALKVVAVGVGLCCRPLLPAAYRSIVPAGLALPWLVAVVANLYTISTVV